MRRTTILTSLLMCVWLAAADAAVDLVTVPSRAYLQLTVYNSEDLTLVRERRVLTMKEGLNKIQFDWQGTLIDPTSVNIMPLEKQAKVILLHANSPPHRPAVCQWDILSAVEGPVLMEIWYFTSGITWQADYVCLANEAETEMTLRGFVKVLNHSGEEYANAQTRVVVGTINLVEKIAELARRGHPRPTPDVVLAEGIAEYDEEGEKEERTRGRLGGKRDEGGAFVLRKPKKVKKEGLSEYFIFTVEGTETVMNGWSKQLRAITVKKVPLILLYKLSDKETGGQLRKFYKFYNKEIKPEGGEKRDESLGQLGECPLPDGNVRAFRVAKNEDLSYVGATRKRAWPPAGDTPLCGRIETPTTPVEFIKKLRHRQCNTLSRPLPRMPSRPVAPVSPLAESWSHPKHRPGAPCSPVGYFATGAPPA